MRTSTTGGPNGKELFFGCDILYPFKMINDVINTKLILITSTLASNQTEVLKMPLIQIAQSKIRHLA